MNINELIAKGEEQELTTYKEIYLSPFDVEDNENNFYSQENIEALADSFLTVGQQQPTVIALVDGKYKIVSGHRRNAANKLLVERGYKEFENVRFLYKEMSEATLELNLIVGNAFNRELTAYEKTEQAKKLKETLIRARDEDGLEVKGKLRDLIADILRESNGNVARMESINKNLISKGMESFRDGDIGLAAAYELSRLDEETQEEVLEQVEAGNIETVKDIKEFTQSAAVEEEAVDKENPEEEYKTPHPESIVSLCYSCLKYKDCNVKTGTCKACDEYINKAKSEKTAEQLYDEEQAKIDKQTKKKLEEMEREEKLEKHFEEAPAKERKIHDIRIAKMYFKDYLSGHKKFELIKNDKDYKPGELLHLMEYDDGDATGVVINAAITWVEKEKNGLKEGYCILGFEILSTTNEEN